MDQAQQAGKEDREREVMSIAHVDKDMKTDDLKRAKITTGMLAKIQAAQVALELVVKSCDPKDMHWSL